jgi:3-dehydroquinate synthase
MEKQLTVNLGSRSYPIYFGERASGEFPARCRALFPQSRFALVTNETLAKLYKTAILQWKDQLDLTLAIIPDGEQFKTVATWESVLEALLKAKLDRKTVLMAFGGGIVGDITGFAAASFLRGVRYIQIPTTLLAMVDSSVGGKTGVNHAMGKNLIGAFHQPSLVWVDCSYLDTLPEREFVAGYGELFKYAFIGGADMFEFVDTYHEKMVAKEHVSLVEGIRRSIALKARVVEQDEKEETGLRAILNFGHTFAHALERFYDYTGIMHGEAVLWGIGCAYDLGKRVGAVGPKDHEKYEGLLRKLPRIRLPFPADAHALYEGMFSDKKTAQGKINFVVPTTPGNAVVRNDVSPEAVLETLNAFC